MDFQLYGCTAPAGAVLEYKSAGDDPAPSFRRARQTRRRKRAEKLMQKALEPKGPRIRIIPAEPGSVGPTPETAGKLAQDPLKSYETRGILSSRQVWAAHAIRRAYRLITEGIGPRVTSFADVMVQNSRRTNLRESDWEVDLKERYADWVDRMTAEKLMVGPVFDMVVEETSLAAIDRKWRRRKGWAKTHLQQSLDLYIKVAHGSQPQGDAEL
ncbi:hypothetical protein [Emcibacter nanhaiensis]|uniref:Uncharacterized protein n=1 Tax=Emcibacter nanhaiensis TaxID=1505037 RepID=A0A501PNE7_9PROT|nr:hypothetical protein [Emcibacter nanhaiensis]TPD61815.1 hypothetical protein FIV46_06295 [Emcibacter nanhaiensis]